MDKETVRKVNEEVERIASESGIGLENIIVFGSRARDDYDEDSDVDILLVSSDFNKVPKASRSREFYLDWRYEELPEPEFICLTPSEFEERRKKKPHIVRTAVNEGVEMP